MSAAPAAATPPVRSPVLSLGTAILAGAGVLLAGTSGPLVACGAAVFLTFVVENDVRTLRIPNWITLPALAGALAWHTLAPAGAGLGPALLGGGLALALLLPPWRLGLLGGGDVKAVAALGAWLGGFAAAATLLIWAGLLGGAIGLPLLAWRRGLGEAFARWRGSLMISLATQRPVYLGPAAGSVAAHVLPFGPVLALATIATLRWGAPWA